MTVLAFMCTGRDQGWDPLCNGGHFLALIFIGLVGGGVLTGVASRLVRGTLGRFLVWLVATITCLTLSLSIGFALA